ncbi:MAG: hypothetical protein JWM99_3531, partial [Verrucomicrobiales bacterium]|nr:hypothetical protein [Verrucomicrobiales bacterium]
MVREMSQTWTGCGAREKRQGAAAVQNAGATQRLLSAFDHIYSVQVRPVPNPPTRGPTASRVFRSRFRSLATNLVNANGDFTITATNVIKANRQQEQFFIL